MRTQHCGLKKLVINCCSPSKSNSKFRRSRLNGLDNAGGFVI
jgi:hypothetical protein